MAEADSLVAAAVLDLSENRTLTHFSGDPDCFVPVIDTFRDALYTLLQSAEQDPLSEANKIPVELTVVSDDHYEILCPIQGDGCESLYLYVILRNRTQTIALAQHRARWIADQLLSANAPELPPFLNQFRGNLLQRVPSMRPAIREMSHGYL